MASDNYSVCPICVCDIPGVFDAECPSKSEVTALDCGHVYHSLCIEASLARSDNCPVCRAKIPVEKSIKLCLGRRIELDDLGTQSSSASKGPLTKLNSKLKELAAEAAELVRNTKEEEEATSVDNDICDLLEKEIKDAEKAIEKIGKKISDLTKRCNQLNERRRACDNLPKHPAVQKYLAWRSHSDIDLTRANKATLLASKSKEEKKQAIAELHGKICHARVKIKEQDQRREQEKIKERRRDETIRRVYAETKKEYERLQSEALRLGVDENPSSQRKKHRQPQLPERTVEMHESVVSICDDEQPVQIEGDDICGFHLADAGLDDYGVRRPSENVVPRASSRSNPGEVYISQNYSENLNTANKKHRRLLRAFT